MPAILTLTDVEKSFFGAATALHPFSLEVQKGEFLAMMGPSGCGKSTTLRLIAGLELPTAGQIKLWERDITDLPPWERQMPPIACTYPRAPCACVV